MDKGKAGEFDVEDAFFGALLGAWFSITSGILTDVMSVVLFALLFLLFGIFFRTFSSDECETWGKIVLGIMFISTSVVTIGQLYRRRIIPRNQITFFSLIFTVWVAICVIKVALTKVRQPSVPRRAGGG